MITNHNTRVAWAAVIAHYVLVRLHPEGERRAVIMVGFFSFHYRHIIILAGWNIDFLRRPEGGLIQ